MLCVCILIYKYLFSTTTDDAPTTDRPTDRDRRYIVPDNKKMINKLYFIISSLLLLLSSIIIW